MQKSFKLTTSEIKNLTKFSYILTDAEYPLQVQPPVCCSDNRLMDMPQGSILQSPFHFI